MGYFSRFFLWIILCLCLAPQISLYSQLGPHLSMFTQNRIYLNPAYSGDGDRAYVQLHVRNQWTGYQATQEGAGSLGTRLLSASVPLGGTGLGFGLNYLSDLTPSGVGLQIANLQLAYQLAIGESQISFGGGFGLQTQSVDGTVFRVRDSGDPIVDEFTGKQVSQAKSTSRGGILFKRKQLHIGLSSSFFNQAQEFSLHAEHTIPVLSSLELNPFFRARSIADAVIIEPGVRIVYQNAIWVGGSFRSNDAIVGMIGASIWKHRLEAGYSIDYTTVNLPVKALLTHEVFCRFNLPNFTFNTVNAPVKTPRFRLN
jgi:type IX secretion system PorP/SprF family membrane protein